MRSHSRISLVIPAYNEAELLPRLLDTVDVARDRYRGGPAAIEVVVADNESLDDTAAIAVDRGCRVVSIEPRRIASVRNGGAAEATGKILCFVDADGQVHPETFNAIEDCLAGGRVVAGSTGVRLERWSLGIAITYCMFVPFVWALRMDTGVVFCLREDFTSVGTYDERRLFGEDVQLLFDLRRLGRKRGQRLVRLRKVKGIASSRKFDKYGDWHYFTDLFKVFPLILRSPRATSDYADKYWYGDQRPPTPGTARHGDSAEKKVKR